MSIVQKRIKPILKILKASKKDPILSQTIARSIFSIVLLLVVSMFDIFSHTSYKTAQIIVLLHLVYALISVYLAYRHPKDLFFRKFVGMLMDLGALSAMIYSSNLSMIFVYPIYLWIIVGNGMRYGVRFLYMALGLGVTFFVLATYFNERWSTHTELAVSLSVGIVVLGIFYATLINKIYKLNNELEQKVRIRTSQLSYQLYHDDLTRLKNRYALKSECFKVRCQELFLIDIDNFKNYNELYGMEAGNTILRAVANALQELALDIDGEAYRIYSDGFVLKFHMKRRPSIENCNLHIINILSTLSSFSVSIDNLKEKLHIDFTVVAVYEKDHVLEKADMALRKARQKGQKYIVYDASLNTKEEIAKNIFWKERIRHAIAQNKILPVFHPIVNRKGEIVKYESLMRMEQDGKLITPYFFLDIAIKTYQYEQLTTIMIDKSFKTMQKRGKDFSINLSLSDINNQMTVNFLIAKIKKHHVGSSLIIEILETEDTNDFKYVQKFVEKIRKLGVRIAIDDFGSGYSNFDHLFKLRPDYLKIDGSLIKKIDSDKNSYKLVESIVFLANNLGIKTIAEFVHSKEVFAICKELQIDEFQGYYFSEPLEEKKLALHTTALHSV